jgi:hypothetical protein
MKTIAGRKMSSRAGLCLGPPQCEVMLEKLFTIIRPINNLFDILGNETVAVTSNTPGISKYFFV